MDSTVVDIFHYLDNVLLLSTRRGQDAVDAKNVYLPFERSLTFNPFDLNCSPYNTPTLHTYRYDGASQPVILLTRLNA